MLHSSGDRADNSSIKPNLAELTTLIKQNLAELTKFSKKQAGKS
jgi:hypothetical protein